MNISYPSTIEAFENALGIRIRVGWVNDKTHLEDDRPRLPKHTLLLRLIHLKINFPSAMEGSFLAAVPPSFKVEITLE